MLHKSLIKANPVQTARLRCRRKFLHYFPNGFVDLKYRAWERGYKEEAHLAFQQQLNINEYQRLLKQGEYQHIALTVIRIEAKTNLLFSFEKMALRDAVKSIDAAKIFAIGLFNYIYGAESVQQRFIAFSEIIGSLPRKQTRVLTWPLQTIFGFLANPKEHFFLKPRVTQLAADKYKYHLNYKSKPNWETYQNVLGFGKQIRKDNADLKPKDNIDLQSFIWVMGSDEYPD